MGVLAGNARRIRKQDAVYWPVTGTSSTGKPTYGAPVAIKVRWTEIARKFVAPDGNERVSRARVIVDRQMQPLWLIKLGALNTVQFPGEPLRNRGVEEIQQFEAVPDRLAKHFLYTAIL